LRQRIYGRTVREVNDIDGSVPPVYVSRPLAAFWNRPVHELVTVPQPTFTPDERERRRLYSLLAMSLVFEFWNGNKYGDEGEYPWREQQRLRDGRYRGGTYLGHNIAAIAVDGDGRVIDFDFNHNKVFNSSVEHAESRLIRRVFSLAHLQEKWRPALAAAPPADASPVEGTSYATVLSDVTVYTTLEPCAQCAGIMALGLVHEVVFLQRDPGEYLVGNILHNLTKEGARAPLPIPAGDFGFEYFDQLNDGYQAFKTSIRQRPFYISPRWTDRSPAIAAFLCTDNALDIYRRARDELRSFRPQFPANAEPHRGVVEFVEYAHSHGRRGTPHRV
jgi:tRNA(Arg) A34 adenosine deaminase TadA